MSSILTSLYKATLGLLVNKVRDKTADKLKDGDVLDQTFRDMIVREIDDIKTKLDGLARKDLLASIDFFNTGIVNLNQVFEKSLIDRSSEETAAVKKSHEEGGSGDEAGEVDVTDTSAQVASFVTKRIENLRVTDLNESASLSLADAKERFRDARVEATKAFHNEALKTSDRILALKIQLMATILERLDRPTDVLDECRICLQKLNAMQEVRENFKVHVTGGVKSWVNKKGREDIIVAVCQVNHVVFRVMEVINGGKVDSISLPCVDVGSDSVDVLCNQRVTDTLLKRGMAEFCRGFWSFGQEEDCPERSLIWPTYVAVNTRGQFIVADTGDHKVKVYSCSGMFQYSICPSVDEYGAVKNILAVATDRNDNVYVLVGSACSTGWVVAFDQHGKQLHKFLLREGFQGYLMTVNDTTQVFVIGKQNDLRPVFVFETDGEFVHSFGGEILKRPRDIASANDGRVLVLDGAAPACVYTFSARGAIEQQFMLPQDVIEPDIGSIAYDLGNQTVFVYVWYLAAVKPKEKLFIYTKDGILVREVQKLDDEIPALFGIRGVAVTADGRIAVIRNTGRHMGYKICVVQKED